MRCVFYVFRILDNGLLLCVTWRETFEEAQQLAAELHEQWPAEYGIEKVEPETPE